MATSVLTEVRSAAELPAADFVGAPFWKQDAVFHAIDANKTYQLPTNKDELGPAALLFVWRHHADLATFNQREAAPGHRFLNSFACAAFGVKFDYVTDSCFTTQLNKFGFSDADAASYASKYQLILAYTRCNMLFVL